MSNADREARRKAARDNNIARRSSLVVKNFELKIVEKKLSAPQRASLESIFRESKWLYNAALADPALNDYKLTAVPVKTPTGTEVRQLSINSRIKQGVLSDLASSKKALAASKARGRKIGRLKFKRELNSVALLAYGQSHKLEDSQLKITGVPGRLRLLGTKQLAGAELGGARLVRKPSGLYLKITAWVPPKPALKTLPPVGMDMGIKTHVTLSDGREWSFLAEESERLKRLQRKLARQQKGSNRYRKTQAQIRLAHERLANKKDNAARQFVSELKHHETVAFQDENLRGWKRRKGGRRGYGRTVQAGALGRVKALTAALPQAVMVDRWEPTTQFCPSCATLNKTKLSERIYECACGYTAPRDWHAARNMLVFAGVFTPEELGGALVEPCTTASERASALSLVSAGVEARSGNREKGELVEASVSSLKRHRLQRCP